ncbi:MAG: bifunctional ADP-dependent NAD(P)H-hydrate dehydratase/NAD(P)H-hydrate epimerase [Propioniciclava sp.]
MLAVLTASAIRDAEGRWFADHPAGDLMGHAARAVADQAAELLDQQAPGEAPPCVLVVAGAGNNAGDALFAAQRLARARPERIEVLLWPATGSTHAEALAAAVEAGAVIVDAGTALDRAPHVSLIIDGVSGLGGRPGLPPTVAAVAGAAEVHRVLVLAVDLPSGLTADRPGAGVSFQATRTVTFIGHKLAHVALPAAARCGVVTCVDLGVEAPSAEVFCLTGDDIGAGYPWPGPMSDKYSRGVVGLDTGSRAYPGAAVLGCSGALHAGAGMVRYVGPARAMVLGAHPSVVAAQDSRRPGRVQAWVCGSGWSALDADRRARRLDDGVPTVLDAAALLDPPDTLDASTLLTPHAGELARLLGVDRAAVTDDPLSHSRRAAAETGACVLLKGATQYSVHPDGRVLIAEAGPSWTATAGSGDVLAGVAGTLLAAGVDAWHAGALAASLQARAAAALPGPHAPDEVAAIGLPRALATLEAARGRTRQ